MEEDVNGMCGNTNVWSRFIIITSKSFMPDLKVVL